MSILIPYPYNRDQIEEVDSATIERKAITNREGNWNGKLNSSTQVEGKGR
jgi:hypothetical protein